jgi:hypothetical protein
MLRFPAGPKPRLALGLVILLGTVAACGSDSDNEGTATTTTRPAVYPLTGLPAGDPATMTRGAMAVKIDNISAARPQSGLDQADVVYEELAEGGLTRFIVVFQSTDAPEVGPVRSARPSDRAIVDPLNGVLAYSGAAGPVQTYVSEIPGVKAVNVDTVPDASYRLSSRSSPHNLYTSTERLYRILGAGLPEPPPLNNFLRQGQPFAAGGATPATNLTFKPGAAVNAAFDWDPATSTWKRSTDGRPHTVQGGAQVAPTNVVVQFTKYAQWPYDSKVELAEVVGRGEAWILSGGMVVKGTWEKADSEAVTVYRDATGGEIRLPAGRTWIELPKEGSAANVR